MSLDVSLYAEVDTGRPEPTRCELFTRNITHNVSSMWRLAGMYEAMYESEGAIAGSLVPELTLGIESMEMYPRQFRNLNPPNGWGSYESALEFAKAFLDACCCDPKAIVRISR